MNPTRGPSGEEVWLLVKVAGAAIVGAFFAGLWLLISDDLGKHPVLISAIALIIVALCVTVVALLQRGARGPAVRAVTPGYPTGPPPVRPARPPYPGPPQHVQPPGMPNLGPPPVGAEPTPAWVANAARDDAARRAFPEKAGVPIAGTASAPEPELNGAPGEVDERRISGRAGGVRRVVQCPECGSFDVEVWDTPGGFAFTCRRSRHTWQWSPGSAWPITVVQPAGDRVRPAAGPS